jgi:Na+-transporting NADH:ubiquinone oxidoreductase subunit F
MNIYTPMVLIGILVGITLVLIALDRLLGGSGERVITINKQTKVPVLGDDTVLRALAENKIFIPSACGGKATCGACKFRLLDSDSEILPTEEAFLSAEERADGIRLACQVKVRGDMQIEIPDSLLTAREYVTVVEHVEDLTYDIKLIRCRLLESEEIDFKPGQYAQLRVPGMEDVIRAYSIASNPKDKDFFELIIRMVPKGLATTFVHKALEVGDRITVTGPFGDFYLREESNRDIVCIAGGSGKAPIRSIVHYLRDHGMPRKVQYFFGARSKRDLYYTEEFTGIAEEFPNFTYIPALSAPATEDNWDGETGLITDVLDRHTGDLSDTEAYLCGSPGMIDACIKVLTKHNIKPENIYYDKF